MYKFNLENGLKANIWINEEPMVNNYDCGKLLVEEKTELFANSKKLVVELFIPRAHNNYALLGIDFLANENGKVMVKLGIDNQNDEKYSDAISLPIDTVICGIMDEFKEGIFLSVDEHLKAQSLPSGIVNYNISAYGEVGSSVDMFRRVSNILLSLVMYDEINEYLILKIIKENIN